MIPAITYWKSVMVYKVYYKRIHSHYSEASVRCSFKTMMWCWNLHILLVLLCTFITHLKRFTTDEVFWASTHNIIFTFSLLESFIRRDKWRGKFEDKTIILCCVLCLVDRQLTRKKRVDGCVRKQWEFMLQIQGKHVAPQILLRLSVNHICVVSV